MPMVKSESISLLAGRQPALNVPAILYKLLQPEAGGIADFYPKLTTVQPSPLSVLRQLERPEVVDLDAAPKITHNLTKDWLDQFAEAMFLANARHPGGTGIAYFTPSARTQTDFIVPAGGALQQGTLVYARGFLAAANNGLFVVGSGSMNASISVAGGVAEVPSGYVATLEVAGFRGAAGEFGLDANGNLTSSAVDFTTLGLTPGQMIFVGGAVGSAFAFATAAYRGFAQIVAVTAHLMSLRYRAWAVGPADPGADKTIDLYWGRFLRNVAFGHPDYNEISTTLELGLPQIAADGATEYVYALGNIIDQVEIDASLKAIVKTATTFVGTTISVPTLTRAAGAATAAGLLATAAFTTADRMLYLRVVNQSDERPVLEDIDTWKLTYKNGVTPQKQQGTLGTKRVNVGKVEVGLDLKGVLTQDDGYKACVDNRSLRFGAGLRNADGGVFFEVPSLTFTDGPLEFAANAPVMISPKAGGFRDHQLGHTLGMSLFPFLPG